eukprot:g2642.t1
MRTVWGKRFDSKGRASDKETETETKKVATESAASSATSASAAKMRVEPIKEVEVNGLVIMKIIKHAHDAEVEVSGSLVGMPKLQLKKAVGHVHLKELKRAAEEGKQSFPLRETDIMKITNCFPHLSEDSDVSMSRMQSYEDDMLTSFEACNMDSNIAGWYESCRSGASCSAHFVSRQLDLQEKLDSTRVIGIVYNPLRSVQDGELSIRAYRLKSKFVEAMSDENRNDITQEILQKFKLDSSNIVEEIPLKIVHTVTTKAMLFELCVGDAAVIEDNLADHLDLSFNPVLERELRELKSRVHHLNEEQNKFQKHERDVTRQTQQRSAWLHERRMLNEERKHQNKDPLPLEDPSHPAFRTISEPGRMLSLIAGMDIRAHCDRIDRYTAKSLKKTFLAGRLHKGER